MSQLETYICTRNEEADTIGSATVVLGIDLGTYAAVIQPLLLLPYAELDWTDDLRCSQPHV